MTTRQKDIRLGWGVLIFGVLCLVPRGNGQLSGSAFRHSHFLDRKEKYLLEWSVNWVVKEVTFNVTVNTKGYVGFGLSKKGKMSGADIVIGGVYNDGRPYFSDRHAVANQQPIEDISQDWTLNAAWENRTHTYLSFSRPFDTCDEDHDLPIGEDVIAVIWAYGETDDEKQYHFQNRGLYRAYLLDPDLTPQRVHAAQRKNQRLDRLGNLKIWTISLSERLSSQDTSYLCTFHRAPSLKKKHHMIGFRKIFPTEKDRHHVHHTVLFRCGVPTGQNITAFYERWVNRPGGICFVLDYSNPVPTQYCTEILHSFSVGATPVFLPDHVGIPLSESQNEYFMYQLHYDNPNMHPNLTINTHLEIYYTDKIRKHDAGVLLFGGLTPGAPTIMIPSHSINHITYGHCGSGCTKTMFPPEGVQIFAGKHHTHLAGTGDRFVHVRNNRELPYLLNDDNFIFDYQPVRFLRQERTVLPGDAVIKRCLYTTTDRNGTATVGGLPTRKEMCTGFFWYYPLVRNSIYSFCSSGIRAREYGEFLGIWNTTWSQARFSTVVTAPPQNAGLTVQDVGTQINWTHEKRNQLQNYHKSLPHITVCPDGRPDLIIPPGSSIPVGRLIPSRQSRVPSISPIEGHYTSALPNIFRSVYSENTVTPYRPPNRCWRGVGGN